MKSWIFALTLAVVSTGAWAQQPTYDAKWRAERQRQVDRNFQEVVRHPGKYAVVPPRDPAEDYAEWEYRMYDAGVDLHPHAVDAYHPYDPRR